MSVKNYNIPIGLIFFNRPDTLRKVFEQVKKQKPSKLLLVQDGARNENDAEGIAECRKIFDEINWECTVYKNYSDINLGCGTRPHSGISWIFENVDEAIILEDDCVPCDTFFEFCECMLYKYRDDKRIGIVSGLNYFNHYDFGGNTYGFAKTGAIWGWATWKDRWEEYDFAMCSADDKYIMKNIKNDIIPKKVARKRIAQWLSARKSIMKGEKVSYWDYQWGFIRHCNSWLSIVPKYSQISNIGIGNNSTHSGSNVNLLPKKIANFFFMETSELESPYAHPKAIVADREYDKKYYDIIYPSPLKFMFRKAIKLCKLIYFRFVAHK